MGAPIAVPKTIRAGIERTLPLVENPYDHLELLAVATDQGVPEVVDWIRENPILYAQGLLHGFVTEGS